MLTVNSYFEDTVKSIGFEQDGATSSVGVMKAGSYTFGTKATEKMTVVKGNLTIKLANEDKWKTYAAGEFFHVEANSSFEVQVEVDTAYLCEYLA